MNFLYAHVFFYLAKEFFQRTQIFIVKQPVYRINCARIPTGDVNYVILGYLLQINLGMFLKDNSNEFSVLVDRSVGGSSLVDGQLELMLHRFALFIFSTFVYLFFSLHLSSVNSSVFEVTNSRISM